MCKTQYYKIKPEVSGNIIMKSTIDRTTEPVKVTNLVYTFDGWLGDDIVSSIGYYIVTEKLKQHLEAFSGSGYVFDKVRIVKSTEFKSIISERPDAFPSLPKFHWLKITGIGGREDFGRLDPIVQTGLVVSEAALKILELCQFTHGRVEPVHLSEAL